MNVAGLDLSTRSSGVATGSGHLCTIRPRATGTENGRRLVEISTELERALRLHPPLPDVVVAEGPADHSPGIRSTIAVAKVRGVIEARLFELGIHYLEIPPAVLKVYAVGNGNAPKDRILHAAQSDRFLLNLAEPANDDEADAYFLRHLGRFAYGLEPTHPDAKIASKRLEVIARFDWPTRPVDDSGIRRPRRSS